jgi:hypothetical protein
VPADLSFAPGPAYRPLSLLAVAGLVLAVAYAALVSLGGVAAFAGYHPRMLVLLTLLVPLAAVLVAVSRQIRDRDLVLAWALSALVGLYALIGLFGLVAYSGTNPWVLPLWTILIPVGTAGLCWMARSRIQASEDTLAGANLANWGLIVSVFFGLNYAAYLASNRFAVVQQADEFVQQWIGLIRDDKLAEAFALTFPTNARPQPTRADLEQRYNMPAPRGPGFFTAFQRSQYVHQLQLCEPGKLPERISNSPFREQNTIRVALQYRVTTPYSTIELLIPAVGSEAVTGTEGRDWHIQKEGIQITQQPTERGVEMARASEAAGVRAREFVVAMQNNDLMKARLALGPTPPDEKSFAAGSLVQARKEEFWVSSERHRDEMIGYAKGIFRPGTIPPQYNLWGNSLPFWKVEGHRFRFRFPVIMAFSDPGMGTKFVLEGDIEVESPVGEGQVPAGPWNVTALRLLRGSTPSPRDLPPPS